LHLVFLTPLASLVALTVVLPLVAALVRERRDGRIRRALGLDSPGWTTRFASAIAATLLLACLSAAAAQPAVRVARPLPARTDAQVFFVLDVSGSMAASASKRSPSRFERASTIALRLRRDVATVPAGVASLSDRVLPHLYPTADERVFAAVLHRSIGIGRPVAGVPLAERSTELQALQSLQGGYFGRVRRRLAVVLTDGESNPFEAHSLLADLASSHVGLLFVRMGDAHEAIYRPGGSRDPGYRPDQQTARKLAPLAPRLVGGRIYDERSTGAAAAAARHYLGSGPEVAQGRSERTMKLGQYAALAAALPLLFLLRRNRG
jgi:von Willebrand factor type A domain